MSDEKQHEMAMMFAMSRNNSGEDDRSGSMASAKRMHKAVA
jgi:hypothetical protein